MTTLDFDNIHWEILPDGSIQLRDEALDINYPDEDEVELGIIYGYEDQYTGSYTATGNIPDEAPAISAVSGDEQVVISLIPAEDYVANAMYVRYWTIGGETSAESLALSRTGAGDVTVTGLTNGTTYFFQAYHKNGAGVGVWSGAVMATPTDVELTNRPRIERIRDNAAAATMRIIKRGLGQQIIYIPSGGVAATLYAIVSDSFKQRIGFDGKTDTRTIQVTIPRQTGFPPTSMSVGGRIKYNGYTYVIDDMNADFEDLNYAAHVVFDCSRSSHNVNFEDY